jgi:hypothetical protein
MSEAATLRAASTNVFAVLGRTEEREPMKISALLAITAAGVIATPAIGADVYKVNLTRKDQDFYEVQGQGIYLKTRFCYEFVYGDEAIVRIDSAAGYVIGKIMFSNGSTCDIAMILRG